MIKVKLDTWESKLAILKQKRKLKGSDIFIDQDRTTKERLVAKNLRELSKKHRAEGRTVKLGYQKITIDNIPYYWNEKSNSVKKSSKSEENETTPMELPFEESTPSTSTSRKN